MGDARIAWSNIANTMTAHWLFSKMGKVALEMCVHSFGPRGKRLEIAALYIFNSHDFSFQSEQTMRTLIDILFEISDIQVTRSICIVVLYSLSMVTFQIQFTHRSYRFI